MNLMNAGFPPPNTNLKNKKLSYQMGQVEWAMGLFSILFVAVLLCAGLQLEVYKAAALYMEDALAAANLASALIDIEEYGISHNMIINEPELHFEIYKSALKENLGLNDDWENTNTGLFSGKPVIECYIIYNVSDYGVEIISVNDEGIVSEEFRETGEAFAPNGIMIEATGVYSEISFPVSAFFGMQVNAKKGKLVDVVDN
ncbi:MAG: hypothetical protein LUG83_00320 [Lachnospiraceae bacterium]|nr:hypothetical protein [Lachnospiraceae bacterium]